MEREIGTQSLRDRMQRCPRSHLFPEGDTPPSPVLAYGLPREIWGAVVARETQPFTAEKDDQRVDLNLSLTRRGVFQIDVDVPGWETRRTPFGMTCESESPPEEAWAVAHRLGLRTCRRFVSWYRDYFRV